MSDAESSSMIRCVISRRLLDAKRARFALVTSTRTPFSSVNDKLSVSSVSGSSHSRTYRMDFTSCGYAFSSSSRENFFSEDDSTRLMKRDENGIGNNAFLRFSKTKAMTSPNMTSSIFRLARSKPLFKT